MLSAGAVGADLLGRRRTAQALGWVESGAMAAELILSEINHHHLGRLAGGLALRLLGRRGGALPHHTASVSFMAAALCFRFARVLSGRASAHDDEAVARMARGRATRAEEPAALHVVQHR
jgi:hypothetical protein